MIIKINLDFKIRKDNKIISEILMNLVKTIISTTFKPRIKIKTNLDLNNKLRINLRINNKTQISLGSINNNNIIILEIINNKDFK